MKGSIRFGTGIIGCCLFLWVGSSGCVRESSSTIDVTEQSVSPSPVSESTRDSDWGNLYGPRFDSSSTETGLACDFGPEGPPVAWRSEIGKGYSAPVVRGGRVVAISRWGDVERVECRDLDSGKRLWQFEYPTTYTCSFEYSNGPYATPILFENRVVAVGAEGQFHCLDLETGELVWKRSLLEEYQVSLKEWPVTTSPLYFDGRIIFNLGAVESHAGLVGLDPETGETLWESTDQDFSHASPVAARIHGRPYVFAMADAGLVCLNPENGDVYWEVPHRIRQLDRYNAVSPIVHGDRVNIVTGPAVKPGFRSFQIGPAGERSEPWQDIRLLNSQYTNLIVQDELLLGFTPVKQGGPELVAIDLRTGTEAWKAKPDLGRGNLLWVDGRLLILGEEGHLAAFTFDRSGLREASRTAEPVLERPCYTSMALSAGRLLARNERELVCFDLRPRAIASVTDAAVATRTTQKR